MYITIIVTILLAPVAATESGSLDAQYCSYFKNRAPSPQPNLKNCTWYKDSACCLQEELTIILYGVPPLVGANKECLAQTNYLMCYTCAPDQNTFYKDERLSVCEEFCDHWYSACKTARLKGMLVETLYGTGAEFCKARNFLVKDRSTDACFFYKPGVHSSASSSGFSGLFMLAAIVVVILVP